MPKKRETFGILEFTRTDRGQEVIYVIHVCVWMITGIIVGDAESLVAMATNVLPLIASKYGLKNGVLFRLAQRNVIFSIVYHVQACSLQHVKRMLHGSHICARRWHQTCPRKVEL